MKLKLINLLLLLSCFTLLAQQPNMGKQKIRTRQVSDPELAKFLGLPTEIEIQEPSKADGLPGGRTLYAPKDTYGNSKYDESYKPGLDYFLEENPHEADEIMKNAIDENRVQERKFENNTYFKGGLILILSISTFLVAYLILRKK